MAKPEDKVFVGLLIVVSVGFAWVIQPFFGAILWGVVAAILFDPLRARILRSMPGRNGSAAGLTLLVIVAVVIVPAILLGMQLLQEATGVYTKIQSGQINVGREFQQVMNALPDWATNLLGKSGVTDFEAAREKLSAGITASFQSLASRALNVGQSAFGFLTSLSAMLYLTFFLLRDGEDLGERIERATPLHPAQRRALIDKFVTVIRATIKGSLVVAIAQGAIGGVVFWGLGMPAPLLWGVTMGFFSLVPAVGTGLIWVPVAIYLLATGAILKGLILIFCGLFVIGLVDNIIRPILVGRDTRMPDYVVLISTLGGISVFGFNGVVIGPVIAALFIAMWEIFAASRSRPRVAKD